MLRSLDIRDILIIDRLVLDARPGLNVLTGETGAGKSILLDALGFVLGWRGRAEQISMLKSKVVVGGGLQQCEGKRLHMLPAVELLHEADGIE